MDFAWFAHVDGSRRGPMTAYEVLQLAGGMPEPEKLPVWREGLADWRELGAVEELRSRLSPYAPPRQPPPPTVEDVEGVARLFRRLVLLVGLWLVFSLAQTFLETIVEQAVGAGVAVGIVGLIATLALLVTISVTAYQLTRALGESSPLLWAILMFIPCVNLIGLLIVSNKSQWWCKRRGIPVGFFGPKTEGIEDLRRRR